MNNLIAQIDDWVIYHLLRTLESDIHYENQLYGPISLHQYFHLDSDICSFLKPYFIGL
jgi:hypothetical protein